MKSTGNRTKVLLILNLAAIAAIIYLLSIFFAYPEFQNTRLADPLAEINSLFPLYYVAIALMALSCVACFLWRMENRGLHILLLSLFALMLWFTPYYLAGFVRLPDGPWHVGVAMQMPQVLGGDAVTFSDYAQSFPGSFAYHYSFLNIVGIGPTAYINTVFPLIFTFVFVLLCYVVISRMFSQRIAFLAMLIAIPGLHYLEHHPSPHLVGTLLLLTILLLLAKRGIATKAIAMMAIVALILSHPITPILLLIFLAAAAFSSVAFSRRIGRAHMAVGGLLIACFLAWFFWYAGGHSEGVYQAVIPETFAISTEYLTGTPFIYGGIYHLNRAIYVLYAIAAILGILYTAVATYSKEKGIRNWASKLGGLNRSETIMALSLLLLVPLAFLLAETGHALIERSLTFIILAVSCLIASIVVRSHRPGISRRLVTPVTMLAVLFLTLSFPIVAYSIDAYSSFPKSERAGLEFVATDISLDAKTVTMKSVRQLALYLRSPLNQRMFLSRCPREQPDLAIFRSTAYYHAAMRSNLSFEDNHHTRCLDMVESNQYDKIYTSPTFEVYTRSKENQ